MNTSEKKQQLIDELMHLPPFRAGSTTTRFRRCGKPGCVCQTEGHPGHGPQSILTYKEEGKTRTRNLPTPTAVEIAAQQIEARQSFKQWQKKWEALNKEICDQELEDALNKDDSSEIKKKF